MYIKLLTREKKKKEKKQKKQNRGWKQNHTRKHVLKKQKTKKYILILTINWFQFWLQGIEEEQETNKGNQKEEQKKN